MNVSYRWLKALAPDLELDVTELAQLLAMRGAPVEGMEHLAEGLGGLVVGRVESMTAHPDADHLTVCIVRIGEELVGVVCGAPNVRNGGLYPFAPVGSSLPGGVEIRRVSIRGVDSAGMLCSERELGLGRDHSGLLELTETLEPGTPLVQALGLDDWRLDVEVTSNRPDLLSHTGIAREVSPTGARGLVLPPIPGSAEAQFRLHTVAREGEAGGVRIRIEDAELCSRYLGAVVRGVRVGPSPEWLASRLRAAGARPINNVVDATNYVLLELGQPLHAFDLHRLREETVVVRRAREGERVRTLDEVERPLEAGMLAICDCRDPVAVAGVMGGESSEVSEGTTDLLLECALFDPKSIRATRKALGMSTDASYRFERGVDPEGMVTALKRALEVIVATAGGTLDPMVLDVYPASWQPPIVRLRPARVAHLLGVSFPAERIEELLTPLGFQLARRQDGDYDVAVPGYRSYDVLREVDLIEEIARVHGYDRFPDTLGPFRTGSVPDDALLQLQDGIRDFLVGLGFFEAHTPAFAPEDEGEVGVSNPVSAEESFLRVALLPGLVRRVEFNLARGARDVRLFDTGTVFRETKPGERPAEQVHLAVVMTGLREPPHWSLKGEAFDVWDLKGVLEVVVRRAGLKGTVVPARVTAPYLDPEPAFEVRGLDDRVLGFGGRVGASALDAPAWAEQVWALELALPDPPPASGTMLYRALPSVPAVERDLALVVPRGVTAGSVSDVMRRAAGELAESVRIFDLYEGRGIAEGSRSIAFRLRFRAPDRTLKDEEVDEAVSGILGALRQELGVEPRGA